MAASAIDKRPRGRPRKQPLADQVSPQGEGSAMRPDAGAQTGVTEPSPPEVTGVKKRWKMPETMPVLDLETGHPVPEQVAQQAAQNTPATSQNADPTPGETGGAGSGGNGGADTQTQGQQQGNVMSREDFQRALSARLEAERRKHAKEIESLRAAAEELQRIKDAQKTAEERLRDELAKAQKEAEAAQKAARDNALRSAIVAEAARQGLNDPMDAVRLLDTSQMDVSENGSIQGIEQAITDLLQAKPYLRKATTPAVPPANASKESGAGNKKTDRDRYRIYFGGGYNNFFQPPNE